MGSKILALATTEDLDIQNKKDDPDGEGGVTRDSLAVLDLTDNYPALNIRLALRLRLRPRRQQVLSFQLFNGAQWNELVPDMENQSVSDDAENFWLPKNSNYYWQGYVVDALWVPRPFVATYTKLQFSNAWSSAQRIDYLVNYEGNTFAQQHIIGHGNVKPHPSSKKGAKKAAKKASKKGQRRGRRG